MSPAEREPAAAVPGVTRPAGAPAPRRRRWLAGLILLYVLAVFLLWPWMIARGDYDLPATIFLFGPRWICALPLLLLVPLAAVWHRRLLTLLALAALVILGPILGFQFHLTSADAPFRLRVLTCNVDQQSYHVDELARLIADARPDIVALQEVKLVPSALVWPPDWHFSVRDEFVLASRYPIEELGWVPRATVPGKRIAFRYLLKTPQGDVQFYNLHLMTPRPGLEAVLDRRRGLDRAGLPVLAEILRIRQEESREVSNWMAGFPGPRIVVGDFNMPVESRIYRGDWSDQQNAFSTTGLGFGFTKITSETGWTYGTRIDHILYTAPWRCVRCWIGPDIGSDHLPLLADFE